MSQLRVALLQINPTVGDLEGNVDLVCRWVRHAAERAAHLAIFPEMALTGYPVEDLALRDSFVKASRSALERTARRLADDGLGDLPVVVGYLDHVERPGRLVDHATAGGIRPENAAGVLYRGGIVTTYAKHHLPNYGVFDEFRYFVRGDRLPVFRLHGVDVGIVICEDLWQEGGPIEAARAAGAALLVAPNASPYEMDKDAARRELVQRRAREANATLAYVNLVGGQDELVFDGGSFVVDAHGEMLAAAPRFTETALFTDLDLPKRGSRPAEQTIDVHDGTRMRVGRTTLSEEPLPPYEPVSAGIVPSMDRLTEVYTALVIATRDYAGKNGFDSALIQLSGGIDSALAATIAADALGPDRVHVVLLPSKHSSEHSVTDAEDLARRLGLHARTVPVAGIIEAFEKEISLHSLAAENLQARVRGVLAMALSNEHRHLVLATGNKSELAVGYSTLYGDTVGGFAPLKDVPKTMVWQLSRARNDAARARGETPPIPEGSITKPPSAELRPGQVDTDALPDYEVLDRLLDGYIEANMSQVDLIAAGHDPAMVRDVMRRVDAAEYKRRQYPPGPKITLKAFGRDRRLPISNRWRESG